MVPTTCKAILFKQVRFTTVHYKHLQAAAVCWYFQLKLIWSSDLTACLQGSNPDVLSCPSPDLCGALYGLSNLASDGCYTQAALENGNPRSPTGVLQSLDADLWNGDFLGTQREWCQTWGHTAAWDTKQLETRPSTSLFHREKWVCVCECVCVGGGFPQRPTAHFALFSWLESDVTELKEASENCAYIYVLVCIVLAVIPVQSIQQK